MHNSLLAGAVAFCLAGPASAAQLILQKAAPGDTGTFRYTIVNPPSEGAVFFSAQVVPGDAPALEILPGSDFGPHDILDGAAYTFSINYRVKPDAPSGPAVLLLTPVFSVAAQDPRRPPVVTPDFVDAMGIAAVLVDRGPAMLLAGNARFSRLPTAALPDALYAIFGTANDDMWLRDVVVERLDGPTPGPVGALPPPAVSPHFDMWTGTSPFLFTDLPAGLYSITARDIFGQQSKLVTVRFQELERVDDIPFDCRAGIGSHFGGQGPREVEKVPQDFGMGPVLVPRYAEVAALSGLAPSRIPAAMTLGTLIQGIEAEQAFISSLKIGGPFLWGGAASFAVGRTEAPRNRYLDLHAIPPGGLVPLSEGMLMPGGPPRVRLELTGTVGDAQVVRRARIFNRQYGAWFLATGDSPPVFGAAQVAPADQSVTVHPEGRSVFIRFQPTIGRGSLGSVRSSIQGLNLDPLCGFNSGTPVGSTVATHIDVDPVLEGPALITLPLEPTLPDAEQALVQVRLQTSSGTENVTFSVDPAGDTVTAQAEEFGAFEIVVATGPDKLPPTTSLAFSAQTPRDGGGLPVVGPSALLPFVVTDAGSGAAEPLFTEYRADAGLYVSSTTPLGLPGGTHEVRFRSWDAANNLEKTRRGTLHVDAAAPVLAELAPSTGVFAGRFRVSWSASDLDPAPAPRAFLVRVSSAGAPVAASTPVPVANGQELSAASLEPGFWVLDVTATDWVGNAASARAGPFEVIHADALPPRTRLALGPPSVPGSPAYVSSSTLLWLEAADDLATADDGLGVGVATKSYRLDLSGPFLQSPATFSLTAGGVRTVEYFSTDLAGNVEAVRASSVAVDAGPPQASLAVTGPRVALSSAAIIVGPQTRLAFVSTDLPHAGVASGVQDVVALVDQTPGSCALALGAPAAQPDAPAGSCANPYYGAPFAVGPGPHTVAYQAFDRVLNAEALKSTVAVGDYDPPAVALDPVPLYTNNPTPSFRAVFTDALAGVDAASLSLSVPGSTLTTSVVSDAPFTWRSGTALPVPMYTHTMLYWKENLYIVGGIDNTALRAQVHRTPLTDGAPLSDWQTTAGLIIPSGVMGAAAAADHLFVMGSFAPGSLAVWQTRVNTDGTLAGWNRGKDLPVQLSSLQGVAVGAAGGYVYAIGGQSSDNAPRNQVYVNTLTSAGELGIEWKGVTALREPMTDSAAAAYGGRIYTVSGRGVGGTASRFVRSAKVVAGGELDGWREETNLPQGRYWGRALAAGGRLYFLGGRDDSSPRREVWSAPIGDDGWLGAWKEEPPLHAPLMLLGAAASPDVLFYSGGANNSGVSAELRYGRLVPEGGFLATATVTAVPAAPLQDGPYTLGASGGDRVLNTGSGSIQFTVDTRPPTLAVSANGLPLVDGETRTLNAAVLEFVAAYSDTSSGVNPSSVSLRLDGADVGAAGPAEIRFSPAVLAPGEHHIEARVSDVAGNAAVVSVRFIYDPTPPAVSFLAPSSGAVYGSGPVGFHAVLEDALSGMATGSVVVTVDGATVPASVAATNSGEALAWREGTDLPEPMYTHTMLYWNGYLYIVGGIDNTAFRSQVHRSSLTDGQPLSGWSATAGLQTPSGVMGAAAAAGRLFVMGSFSPGSLSVWQSLVGAQGALGTWTQGPNLPMPLSSLQGVAVGAAGGFLYAIGGQSGDNVARKEVYVNKLGPGGSLGPGWNEVAPLLEEMTDSAAAAYGGRIYTVSGRGLDGRASNFVRSAPVLSDGKLGGWRVETDLPQGRYWGRALAAGGRLYFLGGRDDASPRSEVWSAAIGQGGFLGAWKEEAPLHAPLMLFGAAASPDVLFYSGGVNNSGASAELRFGRVPGSNASVTATGTVAGLSQGPRVFRVSGSDLAGNSASASVTVHVDLTPPQTSLELLGAFRNLGATAYALAGTPLRLSATDYPAAPAGAGVAASYLSAGGLAAGGATFALAGSTTLSPGLHALAFASVDRVGNFESTKTAWVKLDDQAPAAVTDLKALAVSSHTMRLSWTAPGDDVFSGAIADAEVRLDFGADPNALAQSVVLSSGALAAGQALALTRAGLSAQTTYYARVYTRDTAGRWSEPSNLAAARTFSLAVSSDGVATLVSPVPAEVTVISTPAAAQAYAVAVASQALAPAGGFYELTSGLVFSTAAPALLSFVFDPARFDPAAVAIYTYDPLTLSWSSAGVFNQTLALLANGFYQVSGNILHTSLYAPMVRDTLPPETAFSAAGSSAVLEGRLFAVRGSSGVLTAEDWAPKGGVRSGVAGTFYRIGTGAEGSYGGPFALPEGDLAVGFRSVDAGGNAEERRAARIFVDATAPTLSLGVDQSTFAVPGGFGILATTATITLEAVDQQVAGARSGLASVSVLVDGAPLAVTLQAGDPAASTNVFLLAGLHTVAWSAVDRMGLTASHEVRVAVGDTQAPVTGLTVGAPKAALPDGAILVSAASRLTLAAEDSAGSGAPSGVAAVYWRFLPEPLTLYAGSFTAPAPAGAKTLEFYAVDRAGNAETPPKTQALVLDDAPPALALSYPRPDEGGLCRLAQGRVAVRGSVADPHPARWELGDAGVLLGSGTADADGVLGYWDAAGKTGSHELRLSAADLVENAASNSLEVHAGQPARLLALGGKQVLNKPRGVAAGPDRVYVADTNADRVRVFDAAGVALVALGDKKGPAKLNKPAGLALDAGGNILVADANHKRVVKLSPAGAFLGEYGKGLLKRPMAVALSLGRVVVADAKSGQLAVFAEAGPLLARVELPGVPQAGRHGEDDDDDDEEEPRPMALASDAAGHVWVADAKGGRVLRYAPDLTLAQTIPGFRRPEGVAVTPSGACLAVSDAKEARIRTFDARLSAGLAAFGVRGEIKENRPLPAEFLLNKPAQLAFRADGALLVADRNNDLVQGFGLPGAPVVVAVGKPRRSGHGGTRLTAADGEDEPVAEARVGRLEGGRVEHPDGAAVEIPAGAVAEDVDVAVAAAPDAGDEHRVREAGRSLAGLAAASAAREFSPHGLTFREPALITLPYDPLLTAAARSLKIHYWNPERSAWEALDSEVDEGARTVSARVAHFSVYQVLAPAGAVSVLADPDSGFAFRAIYAFPNPAVGGQKPTVHVAVGRADKVTVRFYDVAGTPVHEATLDTPSVVNDESGPHWAYEYAWNGHIPSGVYIYSVTAEKAGHAPIKRVGKLAVVR